MSQFPHSLSNGSNEKNSRLSCIRSSCATLASGPVISLARSSRRRMLVASTRATSGAWSPPPARTFSVQAPCGPVSASAAISTDASTTTLTVDQRRVV
jgi:hypothetical protein